MPDIDFNYQEMDESNSFIDCEEYPVLIFSLEFTWEEPETYTIEQLEKMNVSKGDLFKDFFKVKTFDYALPQNWLDNFVNWSSLPYHLVLSTTVWIYPENKPMSICTEVQEKIDEYYDEYYNDPGLAF